MMSEIKQILDLPLIISRNKFLKLTSLTGPLAVNVAKEFDTAVDLSGIHFTRVIFDLRWCSTKYLKQVLENQLNILKPLEKNPVTD